MSNKCGYAHLPVYLALVFLSLTTIAQCGLGGRVATFPEAAASTTSESDCGMNGNMPNFSFDRYQLRVAAGSYVAGFSYVAYQLDPKYVSSRYNAVVVGATADVGPGSAQLQPISAALSLNTLGLLNLRLLNPSTSPYSLLADFYVDVIMIERPVAPVSVVNPV